MAVVLDHGTITKRGDGFYGWLVVMGSHICCLFVFGMITATGILVVAVQMAFDFTSARVSWIVSLQTLCEMAFCPVTNVIIKKIGFRLTVSIGTVSASVGMFLSAFAKNAEFLYISCGILVGLGYGLIMPAALGIFPLYVKRNFVLANAIVQAGSGIGNLVFPLVMQSLIDFYGWRGACIVFAAIHANMLIPAVLFKTPKGEQSVSNDANMTKEDSDGDSPSNTSRPRSSTPKVKRLRKIITLFDCSIFAKYPMFIALTVSLCFGQGIGFYGSPSHLIARARDLQIGTYQEIAIIGSVFGIGSLLGRLLIPLFLRLSCKRLTSVRLSGLTFLMAGTANVLSAAASTYALYTTYSFSLGFLSGMFFTLNTQVAKDMLGPPMVTAAVSLYSPFVAIGGLIGPPCAGFLFDITGDFNYSFYFYGTSLLIAGSVLVICSLLKRRRHIGKTESTLAIMSISETTSYFTDKATQT